MAVTSSADGTKLAANVDGGYMWTSSNSGANWTEVTSTGATKNWIDVTSSADGTKLAAVVHGGNMWTLDTTLETITTTEEEMDEKTAGLPTSDILVTFNYSLALAVDDTVHITLPGFTFSTGDQVTLKETSCGNAKLEYLSTSSDTHAFALATSSLPAGTACSFTWGGLTTHSSVVPANDATFKFGIVAKSGSVGRVHWSCSVTTSWPTQLWSRS
jgi:hypothetical protein